MLRLYLYCELKPLLGFIFILGSWLAKLCVSLSASWSTKVGALGWEDRRVHALHKACIKPVM